MPRLQILREVISNVRRVVYLANPDNASNVAALNETKIAASAAGTFLIPVEVRAIGDFNPAFAAIIRERPRNCRAPEQRYELAPPHVGHGAPSFHFAPACHGVARRSLGQT